MDCVHADEAVRFQVQMHPKWRTTMQFAIFAMVPQYGSRDEMTGWVMRRWNDNTYETLACAHKIMRRAYAEMSDGSRYVCEVSLDVRLANGKPLPHRDIIAMESRNAMAWSSIPF
jgi:hypothetical protein